jgi:hypothetical protein
MLDGEENLVKLPITLKLSLKKKVTIRISGKHINKCNANENPFYIYLDLIFPLTYKLLNSVD